MENVCLPLASKLCYRLFWVPSQGKGFSFPWKEEPSLCPQHIWSAPSTAAKKPVCLSPADVQFQAPHALTRFPMLADGAWSGFRGPWGQRNRAGFFRIKEGRDSNQLGQPSQAQAASCRTSISQSPARHWGLSPKASLGESTQGRRGNMASAYTWGGILAQPLWSRMTVTINFLCPCESRFLPRAENQRTLTHLKHFINLMMKWQASLHQLESNIL